MPKELTQAAVENWIIGASGQFENRTICADLGIESLEGRSHLRVILRRLSDKGIIKPTTKDGVWRKMDSELKPIDWRGANPNNVLPLQFPFDLQNYARIFPKSIVVVAGTKNAGKTGFLYNFIAKNAGCFDIDLFNSETGPEQLNERLSVFDIPPEYPFNIYERYDNFADVIHPDHISVIDYIDFNSEVYLVGAEIDAIFQKLNKGVAVVALQKPPPSVTFVKGVKRVIDRDLAYGGAFSAKRSVLYVSMSGDDSGQSGKLKLKYVKNPVKTNVNPNNMMWSYKFDATGVNFIDVQRYYEYQDGTLV